MTRSSIWICFVPQFGSISSIQYIYLTTLIAIHTCKFKAIAIMNWRTMKTLLINVVLCIACSLAVRERRYAIEGNSFKYDAEVEKFGYCDYSDSSDWLKNNNCVVQKCAEIGRLHFLQSRKTTKVSSKPIFFTFGCDGYEDVSTFYFRVILGCAHNLLFNF